MTIDDPDHSDDEYRYIDIGFSSEGRILVVWHTERNENFRIIGSRKAIRTERKAYEEKNRYF
ncbi:MAG: BrnT family toxin [Thermodesulfobacteriota bacterium]|nr:BrnT family toxin [Thermodesulfobacteriota bacterium]